MLGLLHRRAALASDEPTAREPADRAGGVDVGLRVDRNDTGCGERAGHVDLVDLGVRDARPDQVAMRLVRQHDIVGVAPETLQEAEVLATFDGGADAGVRHGCKPRE